MHPTIMVSGTKSYIYNDRDAKISHHQGFFLKEGHRKCVDGVMNQGVRTFIQTPYNVM